NDSTTPAALLLITFRCPMSRSPFIAGVLLSGKRRLAPRGCQKMPGPAIHETRIMRTMMSMLPSVYVPHGGGPCFFMDDPGGIWTGMGHFLRELPASLPAR